MSVPSKITCPLVGLSIQPIMFIIVLFPLPEGPIMATHSPFSTVRLTFCNAFTVPPLYILEMSFNSRIAMFSSFESIL